MIFFTRHASRLENILKARKLETRTKYGDFATVSSLDKGHDLRIIYDIIDKDIKVITFHIAKKGRYI
ncbi:MAG: hypothetical protein AAB875_05975 [Patescibacteria group bacterium]